MKSQGFFSVVPVCLLRSDPGVLVVQMVLLRGVGPRVPLLTLSQCAPRVLSLCVYERERGGRAARQGIHSNAAVAIGVAQTTRCLPALPGCLLAGEGVRGRSGSFGMRGGFRGGRPGGQWSRGGFGGGRGGGSRGHHNWAPPVVSVKDMDEHGGHRN